MSIAIIAHLSSLNKAKVLAKRLSNLLDDECEFDVYISHCCSSHFCNKEKEAAILDSFDQFNVPVTDIFGVYNLSGDAFCFVESLHYFLQKCNSDDYNYVFRINDNNCGPLFCTDHEDVVLDTILDKSLFQDLKQRKIQAHLLTPLIFLRLGNHFMYSYRSCVRDLYSLTDDTFAWKVEKTIKSNWLLSCSSMFIISFEYAKFLGSFYPKLCQNLEKKLQESPSNDALYSHALELCFSLFLQTLDYNISCIYRQSLDKLAIQDVVASGNEREFCVPVEYFVPRSSYDDLKSFDQLSDQFDSNDFTTPIRLMQINGLQHYSQMPLNYQYYYFSDIYSESFDEFNPGLFVLDKPELHKSGKSSFLEYLLTGRQISFKSPSENFYNQLISLGVISSSVVNECMLEQGFSSLTITQYLDQYEKFLSCKLGGNFYPQDIKPHISVDGSYEKDFANLSSLFRYIKYIYIPEYWFSQELRNKAMSGSIACVVLLANFLEKISGRSSQLLEVQAFISLARNDIKRAKRLYNQLTSHYPNSKSARNIYLPNSFIEDNLLRTAPNLEYYGPSPRSFEYDINYLVYEPKCNTTSDELSASCPKSCIYTALYGDYDNPFSLLEDFDGVDFIIFTDKYRKNLRGWKQVIVPPSFASNNLNAKRFKVLPFKYLDEYDYSLYVDANTFIFGNVCQLMKSLVLNTKSITFLKHPQRLNAALEPAAVFKHHKIKPNSYIDYFQEFDSDTVHNIYEASFIFRKHTPQVKKMMLNWWTFISNQESFRDQPSLFKLINSSEHSSYINALSSFSPRHNPFFLKAPHGSPSGIQTKKFPSRSIKDASVTSSYNIYFVYSKNHVGSGSTVMRCFQLYEIIKEFFADNKAFALKLISYEDLPKSSLSPNDILILSKGVATNLSCVQLQKLRSLDVFLVSDFIDQKVDAEIASSFHINMCASIEMYKYFIGKSIPCFYVAHHVDPRIKRQYDFVSLQECKNLTYIGESINARIPTSITSIKTIHVDTSSQADLSWMSAYEESSCHYLLRNKRSIDGFKPFTKGFTAAATGSLILAENHESDSSYYLGAYPLLLPVNPSSDEIIEMINYIQSGISSKDYYLCIDVLKTIRSRSSYRQICNQFMNMLHYIYDD
jgi:hypothetical protein